MNVSLTPGTQRSGPPSGGPSKITAAVRHIAEVFNGVSQQITNLIVNLSLRSVTGSFTVPDTDNGATYLNADATQVVTITFDDPTTYTSLLFSVTIKNNSPRRMNISLFGVPGFTFLYPGQDCRVRRQGLPEISSAQWVLFGAPRRWETTTPSFFVDPINGLDNDSTNDGLVAGVGSFATIDFAYNHIMREVDSRHTPVFIHLSNNTHEVGSGFIATYNLFGSGQIQMVGGGPANTVINCDPGGNCLFLREHGVVITAAGIKFTTSGFASTAIAVSQGAVCDLEDWEFGDFSGGAHIAAQVSAQIGLNSGGTISGNMAVHFTCANSAYINYGPWTIDIPSPLTFTVFASISNTAVVSDAGGTTFTGAGAGAGSTGQQYAVGSNGVLAGSSTTWPGNVAGTTATGGQFI